MQTSKKSRAERLQDLRKLKANKEKYYQQTKSDGQVLYGQGGESRTGNTTSRGKRRYGFKRYSVRQKHRVNKAVLKHRLDPKNGKYQCYTFQSYLYTKEVSTLHSEGNLNKILEIIFKSYSNLEPLLEDYAYGFRDILFSKIVSLTGILRDKYSMYIFKVHYQDLLMDALVLFIDSIDNFVSTDNTTFYTYMVNIIPYRISNLFYSLRNGIKHEDIELDELDSGYEIDYELLNPLGIHILEKFSERRFTTAICRT